MQVLDPRRTVAVILGSSAFPHYPGLASPPSFRNSARDVQGYLTGQLGIAAQRVLDLFDSDQSPMHMLFEVESFLREHTASTAIDAAVDLIFYYVGHGGFAGANRDYYLAIRSTRRGSEGISSIKLTDLASTLNEHAASIRRYLVLDCCFAASAYKELQSGPLAAVQAQTEDALPPRGTALLAAAGRRSPAEAPEGEDYTMFSGALLKVLLTGEPSGDPWWTLTEVGDRVRRYLNERYAGNAIRPEVLSPAQSHGDLARDVRLFPNPAVVAPASAPASNKRADVAVVYDDALLEASEPASSAAVLQLSDLPDSFRTARSTHDLLAAWKTKAEAATQQLRSHPYRSSIRRLGATLLLYVVAIVLVELPILAIALLAPAILLSGRVDAWLGLALTFACVALVLAISWFAMKRFLGERLLSLIAARRRYRQELAAARVQRLTTYARTMVSLLQRWHLGRRSEVIENLCHALDRATLDAKDRYARHTMELRKLDKASSQPRGRIFESQSETQEQRAQRMKSVLLGAMQQSKEARATAALLRASDMTGPDDAVHAMGLFRTASTVLLRLAED